jgi:hypothetical protein
LENTFFSKTARELPDKGSTTYEWYISADKIFKSKTEEFEDFSKISSMEFNIFRFSLFDEDKNFDSAVLAQDVKICMGSGSYCPMILDRLTKQSVIPKITIKRTASLMGKIETLETKEFSQCPIRSFSIIGETIYFSFRYSSYSDSYAKFAEDGSKSGTAAVKIDLAKWEVEDS